MMSKRSKAAASGLVEVHSHRSMGDAKMNRSKHASQGFFGKKHVEFVASFMCQCVDIVIS